MLSKRLSKEPVRTPRRARVEDFFETSPEENEFSFDIKKEMTEKRIQGLLTAMQEAVRLGDWNTFFQIAPRLTVLVPHDRIPQEIFSQPEVFEQTSSLEDTNTVTDDHQKIRVLYAQYPMIAGEREEKVREYVDKDIKRVKKNNEWQKKKNDTSGIGAMDSYYTAFCTAFIAPQRIADFSLSEETFFTAKRYLQERKEVILEGSSEDSQLAKEELTKGLAAVIAFHPGRKEELSIDGIVSTLGKNLLDCYEREEQWADFAAIAEHLAFIAADRVEFIAPGQLNLIRSSKEKFSPKSLPKQIEY